MNHQYLGIVLIVSCKLIIDTKAEIHQAIPTGRVFPIQNDQHETRKFSQYANLSLDHELT